MIGTLFGSYRILDKLGEGGMGEVYRARDLTLGRDVAIKILTPSLVPDPGRDARFEREARLLASLNHPHIGAIYGLERSGDVCGLVLELVEGATLQERMEKGRLPLEEVQSIAREIAEALEAAHDKGIVHRDLKPANIKAPRSGQVKVLDFGIAKALHSDAGTADAATIEATREGVVVGTTAYMSPEQMRGEALDARTDIWAFGCVCFEMLTGRRAFAGATPADTVARVLDGDADWHAVPATVPRRLAHVVRRCLEKDPAQRWRSIADVRFALEDVESPDDRPVTSSARSRPRFGFLAAAATVAIGIATYAVVHSTSGSNGAREGMTMIAGLTEPPGETLYQFADPLKISPDGRQIAMVTLSKIGKSRLWLRSLDRIAPEVVPEADGAMYPFWSPNSRSLGFCAGGQIKILDLATKSLRQVTPDPSAICGGTWSRNDQIVFSRGEGLALIPAAGGEPRTLTTVNRSKGEMFHGYPEFLPDGRHFLFLIFNFQQSQSRVAVGAIDSPDVSVLPGLTSMPVYADPGYLLYARGNELLAQPFDPARRVLSGDPVRIGDNLPIWTSIGARAHSISGNGVLVLMMRRMVTTELTWYERSGRPAGTLGEPGEWVHIALSPDQRTVAAERTEARSIVGAIWTIDVARNVPSRFTPDDAWNFAPIWSPDSTRLAFASTRNGLGEIYTRSLDGGAYDRVSLAPGLNLPTDWSGDRLLVSTITGNSGSTFSVQIKGDRPATTAIDGAGAATVSPDGQWVAYSAAASGRMEVYVRGISGGRPVQISRTGGSQPRWRRDGKELFFVSADRKIVAVPVTTGVTFTASEQQILPIDTQPDTLGNRQTYDVADLGRRFIVTRPTGIDPTPQIAVILNWPPLMRR
jgi:serine/threonine protein kinase/Tol biopolymer transport system component